MKEMKSQEERAKHVLQQKLKEFTLDEVGIMIYY